MFTGGLKQLIQTHVIGMVWDNLEDATAMAEHLDSVQNLANDQPNWPWKPQEPKPRPQANAIQHNQKYKEPHQKKPTRANVKCFARNKFGHYQSQFPWNKEK